MKTVLISTSSLWNCGDDFIREGVMNLLNLKNNIRILWWNRGYGIKDAYANSLKTNLPLIDYFIVAGTPQWIYKNIDIYKYCLKKDIPFSLIGVGTRNLYNYHKNLFNKIKESDLCEIALARDNHAYTIFNNIGFKNLDKIPDPAFFMNPISDNNETKYNIVGWRKQFWPEAADYGSKFYLRYYKTLPNRIKYLLYKKKDFRRKRKKYNDLFLDIYQNLFSPKLVMVHDNREIKDAEDIFGKNNVYYSTDYKEIFKKYANANYYIGSRIHGLIPSIIHGASGDLVYTSNKADAINTSISILNNYTNLKNMVNIHYLKYPLDNNLNLIENQEKNYYFELHEALKNEKERIRIKFKGLSYLSKLIK